MNIDTERQPDVNIMTPAVRRLDASVAAAFKEAITREIGEDRKALIVDFSKIDFIDSSGLGTLVSLLKMMNGKGDMVLRAEPRHPQHVYPDPDGSHFPHLPGPRRGAGAAESMIWSWLTRLRFRPR